MPASGSTDSGTLRPSALAISFRQTNPLRRHNRAGTVGASSGESARYRAAESRTASRPVTQDVYGRGDRNLTRGRYAVWLSPMSASTIDTLPDLFAQWERFA